MKKISVKRELYRGKYYVVHREGKSVVERIRWSSKLQDKKINVKEAKLNFKSNNSIYSDRKRASGDSWRFVEESRFKETNDVMLKKKRPKINKRNGLPYQYVIEGGINKKDGKFIQVVASSQQHNAEYPVDEARQEALVSFYERAHFLFNGQREGAYDADEGMKLVESGKIEVYREGVKHYVPK